MGTWTGPRWGRSWRSAPGCPRAAELKRRGASRFHPWRPLLRRACYRVLLPRVDFGDGDGVALVRPVAVIQVAGQLVQPAVAAHVDPPVPALEQERVALLHQQLVQGVRRGDVRAGREAAGAGADVLRSSAAGPIWPRPMLASAR